jgi:hypothetical protein
LATVILANNKNVELTQSEYKEFITQVLIPNPDWRQSGLISKDEVQRYLEDTATINDLIKIAMYLLIYQENLSLSAYLFSKADSQKSADGAKEYNMPTLHMLRSLHTLVKAESNNLRTKTQKNESADINTLLSLVSQMEDLCLEVGADPL